MRTLLAIAIFSYFLSACQDKNQTPEKTVQDFREAQSAVQNVATLAAPHVKAIFDDVIKPAADKVRADAAGQAAAKSAAKSAEGATLAKNQLSIGLEYTNATYCYELPNTNHTIECFTEPQAKKERNNNHEEQ